MKGFLTLLFSLSILCLHAQTWERVYGGPADDEGWGADSTEDGNFVLIGSTASFGAGIQDAYVIKIDLNGDTLWDKRYGGGATYSDGFDIESSPVDSNLYTAGFSPSFGGGGTGEMMSMRLDQVGTELNTRRFGGNPGVEEAFAIEMGLDDQFVVAGYAETAAAGVYDMCIVKRTVGGAIVWANNYGTSLMEYGYDITTVPADTGYAISGVSYGLGLGGQEWYVVRTDKNGDTLWTSTFGGMLNDLNTHIDHTNDGGFILSGHTQNFGALGYDLLLIKIDGNGDQIWTTMLSGPGRDELHDVKETADGGYIAVGFTDSYGAGDRDGLVVRTDVNGDTLWTRTIGGILDEEFHAVELTQDGYYLIIGYSESFGTGGKDVYVVKMDDNGNAGCHLDGTGFTVSHPAVWQGSGGQVNSGINQNLVGLTTSNISSETCDPCGTTGLGGFTAASGGGLTMDFTDTTTNGQSWYWDFGDGSLPVTTQNPSHTYISAGFYNVCLTVSSGCGTNMICTIVEVGCAEPHVNFSVDSILTDMVYFNDTVYGQDSILWDFGDGNFSNAHDPTHNYTADGGYEVCLTAYNTCGDTTVCDSVFVIGIGIAEQDPSALLKIFPNPATDEFTLTWPEWLFESTTFSMVDIQGREVDVSWTSTEAGVWQCRFGEVAPGMYFVLALTTEGIASERIVVR